ncbi:MAG: biotin--[acetyl-CoA-carboxylase] ligase [Spirochaetaceae bacterium]|nr:biotin--[acetyl-CoA-carboxylase] ligase [Spirochaetaceae bacterium]
MSTKEKVLKYLEDTDSKYVSGQVLAKNLGFSRTAVWKSITDLRKEGAQIEAVTNRGYHLVRKSYKLSKEIIASSLPDLDVYFFDEIDSTNNYCKFLASKDKSRNALVVSNKQLKGRGRLGRVFESPSGGVYFSLLLNTKKSSVDNLLVTSAASIAVSRAIQKVCNIETQIKWVNDIYLNSKKVCGILTEGIIDMEAGRIAAMVVGIGINFVTPKKSFAPELVPILTSLYENESKIPLDVSMNELVVTVIVELLKIWNNIEDRSFLDEYRKRSNVIHTYVNIIREGKSESAYVEGINASAHLLVKLDNCDEIVELGTGEITLRLNNDKIASI